MKDQTAEYCTRALMTWISRFGIQLEITSDRGRQFISSLWKELSSLLSIKINNTTSLHTYTNICIHITVYVCICICECICECTCITIYIYIYIYIYDIYIYDFNIYIYIYILKYCNIYLNLNKHLNSVKINKNYFKS